MEKEKKKKLVVIDSNSLIHRAYHALPPLSTRKGELVNGIYGFLLIFFRVVKELKPDLLVAAFDYPAPTFRHKEYKSYKAKRKKAPQDLYDQIPKVKEILSKSGIPCFEEEGFEADDLIGTIVTKAPLKQVYPKLETVIISGDMDVLQLVNKETKVWALKKGIKEAVFYTKEKVKEKYGGLNPGQLLDFKALRGDPSDNIPGVTGVGEKTAISLINKFKSLENLYSELEENTEKAGKMPKSIREKLKSQKDQAYISKKLAEIKCDIPIDLNLSEAQLEKIDKKKMADFLWGFEFKTLIEKMDDIFGGKEKTPLSFQESDSIEEKIKELEREGIFSQKIAKLERSLIEVIREIERNGIKVNPEALGKLSKNLSEEISKNKKKLFKTANENFNPNSPQQVRKILFEKLKIPEEGIYKTPRGAISTSTPELEKIKQKHPLVKLILKHRELFKLKTGFVDVLRGMIDKKDGRIHPRFHQLGTATGRMSCSDPNLQNIPIRGKLGGEIRKCFVAEKGLKLLSADYSQMELRVAASVANDKKMQKLFFEGKDVHKMTAAAVWGVDYSEVTREMRDLAKTLNFGVLYGMGPRAFSLRTGISFSEAKKFIERYFENFQGIAEYLERTIKEAKEKGFVETIFGRKSILGEINSPNKRISSQFERMAINHPLQGTSADIVKMAMVNISKKMKGIRIILQIHDELLFEISQKEIKSKAKEIKEIMEKTVSLKVPLTAKISFGDNWKELEPFAKM